MQPGGGVVFRLWAPGVTDIQLIVQRGADTREIPLQPDEAGWYTCHVPDAEPGVRYQYRLPDGLQVPDPASRFQPDDIHGMSEVIDPAAFVWTDQAWAGRPWQEAVLYELHVGAFSPTSDYAGVRARLDYLRSLGVTAIELMPVADFPGQRNWGYDGALLYAPDASYGRPEDFKRLVDAAHQHGLMVFLDVVYNHFGPEGNYLHCYAPDFFHADRHTPWGAAINFDGPQAFWVREFFIHNALYWLEEFHLDGLRLDAVDRLTDASEPDILAELATRVQQGPGRDRPIHLVLENDHNDSRRYARDDAGRPRYYTAQWDDDAHHALHVYLTGEADGPYQDFIGQPLKQLGRALAEGFAFQGEASPFRDGQHRGTASGHLPPLAFINFLQNHDQIGNRALGERLHQLLAPTALDAAIAIQLLAPMPPLIFMGEEWDAPNPFLFFCDFGPELAEAVRNGRLAEFARSAAFADPARQQALPDPNDPATFARSCLDWQAQATPAGQTRLAQYRRLLALRRQHIVPLLPFIAHGGEFRQFGNGGLWIRWLLNDGRGLELLANMSAGSEALPTDLPIPAEDQTIWQQPAPIVDPRLLPRWTVCWALTNRGSTHAAPAGAA